MKKETLFALISLSLLTTAIFAQTQQAIPEEARRHFVKGTTLFDLGTGLVKNAKGQEDLTESQNDFKQAAGEFKQAADLAPQWPDPRFNLARAKEVTGDYAGAIEDLKLYLKFKLPDAEARSAQDKIYALEAKADVVANKQKQAEDEANSPAAKLEKFIKDLDGAKWRYAITNGQGGFAEITCSKNTLVDKWSGAPERDEWRTTFNAKQFSIPGYQDHGDGLAQGVISDDGKTVTITMFSHIQGNVRQVFTRE